MALLWAKNTGARVTCGGANGLTARTHGSETAGRGSELGKRAGKSCVPLCACVDSENSACIENTAVGDVLITSHLAAPTTVVHLLQFVRV